MKKLIFILMFLPFIGFGQSELVGDSLDVYGGGSFDGIIKIAGDTTQSITGGIAYYDSKLWYHNGSKWVEVGSGGGSADLGNWSFDIDSLLNNGDNQLYNESGILHSSNMFAVDNLSSSTFPETMIVRGIGEEHLSEARLGRTFKVEGDTLQARDDSKVDTTLLRQDHATNLFIGGETVGQSNTPLATTQGRYNTFIAPYAGQYNTTGYAAVMIGYAAGRNTTTGIRNTYVGYQAGFNSTGQDNTTLGTDAGYHNLGSYSVYIGMHSGKNTSDVNYTSNNNVFIGYVTGENLQTSSGQNTAVGSVSAQKLTTGVSNSFYGFKSGQNTTTGGKNIFIGDESGLNNLTGSSNIAIGYRSNWLSTAISHNTAIGESSQYSANLGSNVSLGNSSLNGNTGQRNTAIGYRAGARASSSESSVFIGYRAGDNAAYDNINNQLIIENSTGASPLIYGNFSSDSVAINGKFNVSGKIKTSDSLISPAIKSTGNLYAENSSAPSLYLRQSGSTSSYTRLYDLGTANTYWNKETASGTASIHISPKPNDGTGYGIMTFFRYTNTTGAKQIQIHEGDGTDNINILFSPNLDSYFNTGYGFAINATSTAFDFEVVGDAKINTLDVDDDPYDATWDGNNEVATKNAIYDKIETIGGGSFDDGPILDSLDLHRTLLTLHSDSLAKYDVRIAANYTGLAVVEDSVASYHTRLEAVEAAIIPIFAEMYFNEASATFLPAATSTWYQVTNGTNNLFSLGDYSGTASVGTDRLYLPAGKYEINSLLYLSCNPTKPLVQMRIASYTSGGTFSDACHIYANFDPNDVGDFEEHMAVNSYIDVPSGGYLRMELNATRNDGTFTYKSGNIIATRVSD